MDKIQIVNWLLTRKCNLRCSYCGIVRDYKGKPSKYPGMKHYYQNELGTADVIESVRQLKLHNPNVFIIWYGGEPLLRKDLSDIINFCNDNNVNYTIITNNTPELQPKIENLLLNTDKVTGLTSSVDPEGAITDDDKAKKSLYGLQKLIQYREFISDVVAEITVSRDNVHNLYSMVRVLNDNGISSSVTFIDIAKTPYYDFSNVTDGKLLVHQSSKLADQFGKLLSSGLDVHMGSYLLPKLWDILPSNYDCKLEENLHNVTIDSDGTIRLCLRIKGVECQNVNVLNMLQDNGSISPILKSAIRVDKREYCRRCNWTCPMMSAIVSKDSSKSKDLLHSDRRK